MVRSVYLVAFSSHMKQALKPFYNSLMSFSFTAAVFMQTQDRVEIFFRCYEQYSTASIECLLFHRPAA